MQFSDKKHLNHPLFSRDDVTILEDVPVYEGFFKTNRLTLEHQLFERAELDAGLNGKRHSADTITSSVLVREIVHRQIAVAAVLYDKEHDAIGLIEQFRAGAIDDALSPWTLEGVAGMQDHVDESLDQLMRRELIEEAGIEDCTLHPLIRYFPSPGGWGEQIQLYCAVCDLSGKQGQYGLADEGEDLYLHVFKAQDVFDVLYSSRINNAATLIGLQWLQQHRHSL